MKYECKMTQLKANHTRIAKEHTGISLSLPLIGQQFFMTYGRYSERLVKTSRIFMLIQVSDTIYYTITKSGSVYEIEILGKTNYDGEEQLIKDLNGGKF